MKLIVEDYVTLVANYIPLQDAYGGPNYFAMDPNALYEIHIDNDGDAVEDITFQFRFQQMLGAMGSGFALPIGEGENQKSVAIPLKNFGNVDTDGSANFYETYSNSIIKPSPTIIRKVQNIGATRGMEFCAASLICSSVGTDWRFTDRFCGDRRLRYGRWSTVKSDR